MSSLNLDRNIAVVTGPSNSHGGLRLLISEFDCQPLFFEPSELEKIDSHKFDAIIFDDLEIKHDVVSDRLIRKFQSLSLPIAAIGKSIVIVARIFGPDGLEVASSTDSNIIMAY